MKISEIEAHLDHLKDQALQSLGLSADVAASISLADAPDPELGDRGFPTFALAKSLRKAPPLIAQQLAETLRSLTQDDPIVAQIIPAGPYVNFKLNPAKLAALTIHQLLEERERFGADFVAAPERWMIEYSAPNTNKPQHLGHVRNNLLGACVSRILAFAGHHVTCVNLINDRGIHICKSMLAYQRFGLAETPESSSTKGDHLVGHYYVVFNTKFEEEYALWQSTQAAQDRLSAWQQGEAGLRAAAAPEATPETLKKDFFKNYKDAYFNQESELGAATKQLLLDWERGDEAVLALWRTMNQWVFEGFEQTYARLGVGFDHVYYESQTYLLGKDLVQRGLEAGVFHRLEGGAIACNLGQIGLEGDKILLRSDGTSVYMTQDLGTAMQRFDDHNIDRMIYVVGDEQRHHFHVLFGVLGLLRPALQGKLSHLAYGMVELPRGMGRMKSREGTVVDADDLMQTMHEEAAQEVAQRYAALGDMERSARAEAIGLSALKFFILSFNPTTTVHFDPGVAIKFQGKTGPYVLYAYARICSIERELGGWPNPSLDELIDACASLGTKQELDVLARLRSWPHSLLVAARDLDPSKIADFAHTLASDFSSLYNHSDHIIKQLEGPRRIALCMLCQAVAEALRAALNLLGIDTIEQM